jgi:hypothetical protein
MKVGQRVKVIGVRENWPYQRPSGNGSKGTIKELFSLPMSGPKAIQYAWVSWDDGTHTGWPLDQLISE